MTHPIQFPTRIVTDSAVYVVDPAGDKRLTITFLIVDGENEIEALEDLAAAICDEKTTSWADQAADIEYIIARR